LARAGRVIPLGSFTTGLMVWRDLDYGVDAPDLSVEAAFETMLPLIETASTRELSYRNETDAAPGEARFYFIISLDGWKVDVSIWTKGVPTSVEEWTQSLPSRLDAEARLGILRLKDAWHWRPEYPSVVGGYEICIAVLEHGVRTPQELDAFLRERGLPTSTE
jgi:hypothetical protein